MTKNIIDIKNIPGGKEILNRLEKPFLHLINGKLVDSAEHFDVLNPADNKFLAPTQSWGDPSRGNQVQNNVH